MVGSKYNMYMMYPAVVILMSCIIANRFSPLMGLQGLGTTIHFKHKYTILPTTDIHMREISLDRYHNCFLFPSD